MKKIIKSGLLKMGLQVKRATPIAKFTPPFSLKNVRQFLYFKRMIDRITSLEGAAVECGMGQIRTFQMLALLLHEEGKKRALFGFDSFAGFPNPTEHDQSPRNPKKGEWKYMTKEDAEEVMNHLGVKIPIKITEGFVTDSFPKADIPPIALLHLDVDLYESYKTCLEYLFPKVVRGGIVMFDEYLNADAFQKFPGAQKAIDEFFHKEPKYQIQKDPFFDKYFLIKT